MFQLNFDYLEILGNIERNNNLREEGNNSEQMRLLADIFIIKIERKGYIGERRYSR